MHAYEGSTILSRTNSSTSFIHHPSVTVTTQATSHNSVIGPPMHPGHLVLRHATRA